MRIVHRALGISLVEVMVTLALLVATAGGMARTYAHVRASASQATALQAAWRLAGELAEWLRLRGDAPLGKLPDDPASLIALSARQSDCYGNACRPPEAARFFLQDWYRRLRTQLPGFRLLVCQGPGAPPLSPSQSSVACAVQTPPGGVWFRLWKPQPGSGTARASGVELSVSRAP